MKLHEKLKEWQGKDILVQLLVCDDKGYKGKLMEVGEDYFILDELDEGGEKYTERNKLYLFHGILSIVLYRE